MTESDLTKLFLFLKKNSRNHLYFFVRKLRCEAIVTLITTKGHSEVQSLNSSKFNLFHLFSRFSEHFSAPGGGECILVWQFKNTVCLVSFRQIGERNAKSGSFGRPNQVALSTRADWPSALSLIFIETHIGQRHFLPLVSYY